MEWKETVSGVVIGAILAGAGVLFVFQERISKLEVRVKQLEGSAASVISKDPTGFDNAAGDVAEHWDGTWEHTEAIAGGTGAFTGTMRLYVKSVDQRIQVTGWADNAQGGRSELDGYLSEDGRIFSGDWYNDKTSKRGRFLLRLVAPTTFQGNYAMKGKPLSEAANSWSGQKR